MRDVRNSIHHNFKRDRNLLFNLFGRDPWPLRDYFYVIVRDVRIRLNRELVESDGRLTGFSGQGPAAFHLPLFRLSVSPEASATTSACLASG